MSYLSFVPLRPFFYAAFAKRWKVKFRQGFTYFNSNVDSMRHISIRTAIFDGVLASVIFVICSAASFLLCCLCEALEGQISTRVYIF